MKITLVRSVGSFRNKIKLFTLIIGIGLQIFSSEIGLKSKTDNYIYIIVTLSQLLRYFHNLCMRLVFKCRVIYFGYKCVPAIHTRRARYIV